MTTDTVRDAKLVIAGKRIDSSTGQQHENLNPATGTALARVAHASHEDVDAAVDAARDAFPGWRTTPPEERSSVMLRVAAAIRAHSDDLARLESLDAGKPLRQAAGEVAHAARAFEYYGGMADKLRGTHIPTERGLVAYTVREPLGVSAQIVPWNFPIAMTARGVAPALATGNTVVVKPALEAPMTPVRLGELALEAGLPAGVLNIIPGDGPHVGARLANHSGINQLTFTGSVETGIAVMKSAADNVVPLVLELGGKSPNIVFADADVDAMIASVTRSVYQNAGQSCSAASRLIVQDEAHDRVMEALVAHTRSMSLGPGIEDPDMGPLITDVQMQRVLDYLDSGQEDGAEVVAGGRRPDDPRLRNGYFVEPTVLDRVPSDARVAREEIFGPVLCVSAFSDVDEAIAIANDTDYGLAAGIWTRDVNLAHRFADDVQAGQVFVNTFGGGKIELPFGGFKKSGFGRLRGLEALDSFVQVKNVCIKYG